MRQYFLTTDRLGFSHWTRDDLDLAMSLWGDAEVTKYICASGVFTKEEMAARLALEVGNLEKYGVQYFPLFDLETGDLIGCCGLRPYGDTPHVFEVGCHLRPRYWGKGIGTEAGRAIIDYAFGVMGVQELHGGHNPANKGSAALFRKLGFVRTGEEFYPPTGLMHPAYVLKK